MFYTKTLPLFIISTLILLFILSFISSISISIYSFFYFFLIVGGFYSVVQFWNDNSNGKLFFGCFAFFTGIFFFFLDNFTLVSSGSVYLPAVFLIISFSLLVLYVNSRVNQFVVLSAVSFVIGLLLIYINRPISISLFAVSLWQTLSLYWVIIVILIPLLVLILFSGTDRK